MDLRHGLAFEVARGRRAQQLRRRRGALARELGEEEPPRDTPQGLQDLVVRLVARETGHDRDRTAGKQRRDGHSKGDRTFDVVSHVHKYRRVPLDPFGPSRPAGFHDPRLDRARNFAAGPSGQDGLGRERGQGRVARLVRAVKRDLHGPRERGCLEVKLGSVLPDPENAKPGLASEEVDGRAA